MKKIITLAVLGMLGAVPVSAQTVYDAANIAKQGFKWYSTLCKYGRGYGCVGRR